MLALFKIQVSDESYHSSVLNMDRQVAEAEAGSKSKSFFDGHKLREDVILHDEAAKSSESFLVQKEGVIDHY